MQRSRVVDAMVWRVITVFIRSHNLGMLTIVLLTEDFRWQSLRCSHLLSVSWDTNKGKIHGFVNTDRNTATLVYV
ncbi:hypothetical protein CY34DRAFT_807989 [Suillus luteus UH-Slu-Lm8-n1]|uniref:Uncharacterized protein n=1 Tax=Suillus luteus UH-Slu-Lm8-n1 TaxID=930992 RepID=A0A0D0AZE6_9AGAM|nr:hypothetical protein CY34DRAFT_807989 [Suillus luteus UH-Slu-Lm8-n1]